MGLLSHVVGVLGASKIAPVAMLQPARRRTDVIVKAVGSRSLEKAQAYATEHGVPVAYGSYEELIADPDITLIYNALPPAAHAKWSIAALHAGKHVLCEKPITMSGDEASALATTARIAGRHVIEAFHDRYHPAFLHLLDLRDSGRLGTITEVSAEVSISTTFNPDSFRYDPVAGGGALMEFGCYPVRWLRNIVGEEPSVTSASAVVNPLGADSRMEAALTYPSGARGHLLADGLSEAPGVSSRITMSGSRGKLIVDDPIVPHAGLRIHELVDGGDEVKTFDGGTSYDYQLAAVLTAIETDVPAATSAADFVPNMELIDRIYATAGMDRSSL